VVWEDGGREAPSYPIVEVWRIIDCPCAHLKTDLLDNLGSAFLRVSAVKQSFITIGIESCAQTSGHSRGGAMLLRRAEARS
jgi:hypothetical protein